MTFTKTEFERTLLKHGHTVIIFHTAHKIHCDCWNPKTNEGNPQCEQCFGTGWLYNEFYYTKTRRSKQFTNADGLEKDQEVNLYTSNYKYFFKVDIPIAHDDMIIEISNKNGRLPIAQFIVKNIYPEIGEEGEIAFLTVLANQNLINQKKIQQTVSRLNDMDLEIR